MSDVAPIWWPMSGLQRRSTVLVLDDEPAICTWLTRALEPHGYQVIACTHVEPALRTLTSGRVDAAILDVCLPGSSGLDVLDYIRRTATLSDLPALILTGCSPLSDDQEARIRRNMAYVLYKPEGAEAVVSTLSRLLTPPSIQRVTTSTAA
jgi:CheY-like chemotaxis protein